MDLAEINKMLQQAAVEWRAAGIDLDRQSVEDYGDLPRPVLEQRLRDAVATICELRTELETLKKNQPGVM